MLMYGSFCAAIAGLLIYRLPREKWAFFFEKLVLDIKYNILANKEIFLDKLYAKNNVKVKTCQQGRVAVITGGARGIGFNVVKMLLELDMEVVIACRSITAGNDAISKIRETGIITGRAKVYHLDNCSLTSVRNCANEIKRDYQAIHVLINNAGIMFCPYRETEDGHEQQWVVNYLAHFLFTSLLSPLLKAGGLPGQSSRIVNVTSCAHILGEIYFDDINHKNRFLSPAAYAQSKLAQVVFTKKLQDLLEERGSNVQVYSVHPGIVNTDLFEHSYLRKYQPLFSYLFKTPEEGAIPIVYTALSSALEEQGGAYISNCRSASVNPLALSLKIQDQLFQLSLAQVNLSNFFQT